MGFSSPRIACVMALQIFQTYSRVEPFYYESCSEISILGETLRNTAARITIHHKRAMVLKLFGRRTHLLVKIEDPQRTKVYLGLSICGYVLINLIIKLLK